MTRQLFWLSDDEWERIQPYLPRGRRGAHRVDDHRVISGIIHMLKTGARWRDCPADYGPYTTIYNRFNRWSKRKHPASTALTGRGCLAMLVSVAGLKCPLNFRWTLSKCRMVRAGDSVGAGARISSAVLCRSLASPGFRLRRLRGVMI